jgi:RNA polymerase sigma-70 factor (ECF subfamily)
MGVDRDIDDNPVSYEEIYRDYYERIVSFFSRSVGASSAEDLAQDVFVKVHRSLDTFERRSSVYTWIYRIAVNALIDHLRKIKNEKKIIKCDLADRTLFYRSDSNYLTEEFKIVQNEMHECICSYIKMLPDRYKTAVILHEYEGMGIREIAESMDIKPDSARVLLKRARKKLRELLNNACDFYYNEMNSLSCEKK